MNHFAEECLLRIFIGENDRFGGRPLHEAIVRKARETHMKGATVLRGQLGYGRSAVRHSGAAFWAVQDFPLIVEIVDAQEKLEEFMPHLRRMAENCLMTLEKVNVLQRAP